MARSATYTVERRIHVDAPPELVRERIVDFRRWPSWSPWEDVDPDMVHDYGGAETGVGAWTTWSGNRKAGEGRMEITAADETSVAIDLQFLRPFKSRSTAEFHLHPRDRGTEVVWTMHGPMNLFMRIMRPIWSMDKMIGKDFDKGLTALKNEVEPESAGPGTADDPV